MFGKSLRAALAFVFETPIYCWIQVIASEKFLKNNANQKNEFGCR